MEVIINDKGDKISIKIYKEDKEIDINEISCEDKKKVEDIIYKGYSIIKSFY